MYLGAEIAKMILADGSTCWTMKSDKYVKVVIKKVEEHLVKHAK